MSFPSKQILRTSAVLALLSPLGSVACGGSECSGSGGIGSALSGQDCASDSNSPQGDTVRPVVEFGEDQGTLSTSAAELFGKTAGNPNPKTLVGIFETTGFGSDQSGDEFTILSNTWRMRREQRQDGVALALECKIEVGGGFDDEKTLTVFTSSAVELYDWGIKVLGGKPDKKSYTGFGYNTECSVEIPPMDMPYCVGTFYSGSSYPSNVSVPDGYSLCVTVQSGTLKFVGNGALPSGEAGKKISN